MRIPFLVDGAKSTGAYFEVRSPFDGSFIAEVEKPDAAAIEGALANADAYHRSVEKLPAWRRYEILSAVSQRIAADGEELAMLIASEGGKPYKDALAEAKRAVVTVRLAAAETMKQGGEHIPMDLAPGTENSLAFTIKEPVGPVLAISAFNHPVNLICHQAATAIAAGCPVIIKPSEKTPLSAHRIVSYFLEAGLPAHMISFLPAPGSEIAEIIPDRRVAFVSFIGSSKVGWELRKKLAPGAGIALEHGGAAIAAVDESADLEKAAASLVKGAFYHAGQVCVSTQTIFVHESRSEEFTEIFLAKTTALVTGDPKDGKTDVGPIISSADRDRIMEWIKEAEKSGARILTGGKEIYKQSIEPTVLTDISWDMAVFRKEIFGPVVNIMPYKELAQVIEAVNGLDFMFQNSIFTRDMDKAIAFGRSINTKSVIINEHTAFRVDWMPFGGGKDSGMGVGGVKYNVADLLTDKLFVVKL